MNRLSLRTRLVAVAVMLVTFAVVATGIATYAALHRYLFDRMDAQVRSWGRTRAGPLRAARTAALGADHGPAQGFVTSRREPRAIPCPATGWPGRSSWPRTSGGCRR